MGPTLTVIKTKGGVTCGGFTMQNWNSYKSSFESDKDAFVFRVDTKTSWKPIDPNCAIYQSSTNGPSFGLDALTFSSSPMNAPNNGSCSVNLGSAWDTFYNV
jgi:hypothetical protein